MNYATQAKPAVAGPTFKELVPRPCDALQFLVSLNKEHLMVELGKKDKTPIITGSELCQKTWSAPGLPKRPCAFQ